MEDLFEQVGRNIGELLHEQKMKQVTLAKSLGISKQVMHKIISGSKAINIQEIKKIAEVLQVSIDRLMKNNTTENPEPLFCFMGEISQPDTQGRIDTVRGVIDEILFLEDYLK